MAWKSPKINSFIGTKTYYFLNFPGEQLEKDLFNIGDEDAIANKALKSCLKILDKEKYPQIAASSYYLLSDIYIPDDTNPLCPKFSSGQDTPEPQRYLIWFEKNVFDLQTYLIWL